jgi:hypothetical protein
VPIVWKSGSLNLLEPSGTVQLLRLYINSFKVKEREKGSGRETVMESANKMD